MNKEDEIIRQDYNRAVNMWNETYSKCKIVDLKGKSLSVEPMFDICLGYFCQQVQKYFRLWLWHRRYYFPMLRIWKYGLWFRC